MDDAQVLRALGDLDIEQRLDGAAEGHRIEVVGQVVHPLDHRDGLPVRLVLGRLLDARVHVADDRLAAAHDLALQGDEQAQHPVGGGMVRPHVERQQLARPGGLASWRSSGAIVMLSSCLAVVASPARAHCRVPRDLAFVVGEDHRLAADREVAALRVALVVLGHEDAAQVGMPVEHDAEHVVDLALLVVGAGPDVDDGVDVGAFGVHAHLDGDPVDLLHVEQLVEHPQPRLVGVVVDAVKARQERVAAPAEVLEHGLDGGRAGEDRRALAEIDGVENRVRFGLPEILGDQLQAGGVRHRRCPPGANTFTALNRGSPGIGASMTSSVPRAR